MSDHTKSLQILQGRVIQGRVNENAESCAKCTECMLYTNIYGILFICPFLFLENRGSIAVL